MALIVQKFGGTSVGSVERIEAVAERVSQARKDGHQVVVVVSAMSGETNRLLDLATKIDTVPTPRELDVLLSTGEQVTIALLAMALNKRQCPAVSLTADQVRIRTDNAFNHANIIDIDTEKMTALLNDGHVVVAAGFQGRNSENEITTLGRGGSDASAVAIASALEADECQIFTDVDGVYTTDPRLVSEASRIEAIHFDDMTSMARNGAKVLQLQSVEYAKQHQVPLRVLSSFEEGEGTFVSFCTPLAKDVVGIALKAKQTLVNVELPVSVLQQQLDLFGFDGWCHSVEADSTQLVIANECLARLKLELNDKMQPLSSVSTLSLIGHGMQAMCEQVSALLVDNGVQVHQYKVSERCLSLLINEADHQLAVSIAHKTFVVGPQSLDNQPLLAVS